MQWHFSKLLASLTLILIIALGSQPVCVARSNRQEPSSDTESSAQKQEPATTTDSNHAKRPLAIDEDPAMIGKRNLNKGLISKMSMSVEKEVALGRQLAAEVDRQAKFIDDPMVMEYVNRVAQNLVIHSDAKVTFTVKVIDSDEVNAFALPVVSST